MTSKPAAEVVSTYRGSTSTQTGRSLANRHDRTDLQSEPETATEALRAPGLSRPAAFALFGPDDGWSTAAVVGQQVESVSEPHSGDDWKAEAWDDADREADFMAASDNDIDDDDDELLRRLDLELEALYPCPDLQAADDGVPRSMVLRDIAGWRLISGVDLYAVLVLWATISEDPASWAEMSHFWPRYWIPGTPQSLTAFQPEPCDPQTLPSYFANDGHWIFFDFVDKRILTGTAFPKIGPENEVPISTAETGDRPFPLSFCLPPWWELIELVGPDEILLPRESPLASPQTNRQFLYGDPLIDEIARQVLLTAKRGLLPPPQKRDSDFLASCQSFIVDLHRNWLMKPRQRLQGKTVRQLLHAGNLLWHTALLHAQMLRLQEGAGMVAIPTQVADFANHPPGREEIIVYFDLCRNLIQHALRWCHSQFRITGRWPRRQMLPKLKRHLASFQKQWMNEPAEVGICPIAIIEHSRRRVPQAPGVTIVGMEAVGEKAQYGSCECPICQMLGSEGGAVGVTMLSGRELELDGEFAFSIISDFDLWQEKMADSKQQWEQMQQTLEREKQTRNDSTSVTDPWDPVWKSSFVAGAIPGDVHGHVTLAFRLAEIVGTLQLQGATYKPLIQKVNANFRDYRLAGAHARTQQRLILFETLEVVAQEIPELASQVADFQSLVLESERRFENDRLDPFHNQ